MLLDLGLESADGVVPLANVGAATLESILSWLGRGGAGAETPPSLVLDVVLAADYLDMPDLLEAGCRQVSEEIVDMVITSANAPPISPHTDTLPSYEN
jgi:hypothetical protein